MLRKALLTCLFLGGIPAWAVNPEQKRKLAVIHGFDDDSIDDQKVSESNVDLLTEEEERVLDAKLHKFGLDASIDGNKVLGFGKFMGKKIPMNERDKLKNIGIEIVHNQIWGDFLASLSPLFREGVLQQKIFDWYLEQATNGHLFLAYRDWCESRAPKKREEERPQKKSNLVFNELKSQNKKLSDTPTKRSKPRPERHKLSMMGFPLKNLASTPKECFDGNDDEEKAANKKKFGEALNVFLNHFGHTEATAFEISADFFQPSFEISETRKKGFINLHFIDDFSKKYAIFAIDKINNDNGSRGFFECSNQIRRMKRCDLFSYAAPFGFATMTGANPAVNLVVYFPDEDGGLIYSLMKRPDGGFANSGGMVVGDRDLVLEAIETLNTLLTDADSPSPQTDFSSIRSSMEKVIGSKLSKMFEEVGNLPEQMTRENLETFANEWASFLNLLPNGVTYEVVHAGPYQDPRDTFVSYNTTIALAPTGAETAQIFSNYYNSHQTINEKSKGSAQLKVAFDEQSQFKYQIKEEGSNAWRDWDENDFFSLPGHETWVQNIARNSRQTDSNPNKVTVHVSQASLQAIARNVLSKKAETLPKLEPPQEDQNAKKMHHTIIEKFFPMQSSVNPAGTDHFTLSKNGNTLFQSDELPKSQKPSIQTTTVPTNKSQLSQQINTQGQKPKSQKPKSQKPRGQTTTVPTNKSKKGCKPQTYQKTNPQAQKPRDQTTTVPKNAASWSRSRKITTSLVAAAGITGIALVAYNGVVEKVLGNMKKKKSAD